MPELPEVETICRSLSSRIKSLTLTDIELKRLDLRYPIPKEIINLFINQKIISVNRRSKYILINFDNDHTLIIHLGMSGRLFFTDKNCKMDKHDHVLFDFKNKIHMRYRDPRRFGFISYVKTCELNAHKFFSHLGPEPLSEIFDGDHLYDSCHHSLSPIKSVIMNASVVVGVGNIYANEALFLSNIRPQKKAHRVSKKSYGLLCKNIKKVLAESIKLGGTTFRDYVNTDQEPGLHQLYLRVYNRENKPCKTCQTHIKRVTQSGRSSFYCPECQK